MNTINTDWRDLFIRRLIQYLCVFFRRRSGSVRILSAKVGLALLSAANVTEKYNCRLNTLNFYDFVPCLFAIVYYSCGV